jgi:2'-hydroxyisoflavone reductase
VKLLIIGGTRFVGRHLTAAALQRGHDVTLFHRGQSNPDLFPEAKRIIGDRAEDVSAMADQQWDAVIDTCGYVPRVVRMSAQALVDKTERYLFISTISVYDQLSQVEGLDEDSPLGSMEQDTEEITGETYGPLKVRCEEEVQAAFPDAALIIRPGLIVGPYDPTDRFTYWPLRIGSYDEVASPDCKDLPVQMIDARDLADFCLSLLERSATGIYNAVGPAAPLALGEVLETCRSECNPSCRIEWIDPQFLTQREVQPWMDFPFVVSFDEGGRGTMLVKNQRAIAAGLAFRSAGETIRDTFEWAKHELDPANLKAGMQREREQSLLDQWKNER